MVWLLLHYYCEYIIFFSSLPILTRCRVEWLVVDECDKLFEEGFYSDVTRSFREQLAFIYKYFEAGCGFLSLLYVLHYSTSLLISLIYCVIDMCRRCDNTQGSVRRALFSATYANDLHRWATTSLDNLISVHIGDLYFAVQIYVLF